MKKITLILAFIGMITLQSCSKDSSNAAPVDNDTISEVFEYSNVNFTVENGFSQLLTYPHSIYTSDMVLVYRLSGNYQGEDIWKPLPETYFFNDGTLDLRYDFDFTRFDTELHMEGFDLPSVAAGYSLSQVFRVVVVPAYFGKQNKVNVTDYNAVMTALNLKESSVIKVQ
jgi:hypothetical protein